MNNRMICCKCKKRPAVIFVSKVEGEKTTQEGFCIKCATELNIGPIKQMMQNMGITEDDIDAVSEQFSDIMDNMDDFQLGGAGTMPFMQNLFGAAKPEETAEGEELSDEKDESPEDEKDNKKSSKKAIF